MSGFSYCFYFSFMRRERGDRRVILLRFVHKLPVTNRTGTLAIEMPAASIPIKHCLSRLVARFPGQFCPNPPRNSTDRQILAYILRHQCLILSTGENELSRDKIWRQFTSRRHSAPPYGNTPNNYGENLPGSGQRRKWKRRN